MSTRYLEHCFAQCEGDGDELLRCPLQRESCAAGLMQQELEGSVVLVSFKFKHPRSSPYNVRGPPWAKEKGC